MVAVSTRVRGARIAPMVKGRPSSESVANLYSAAGGDVPHDGRHRTGRHGRLFSIAGVRLAAGGLSDYPGPDVLSGRESRGGHFGGDGAAGEAVWPGARPEPDDLHQFLRQLADHSAVLARSQH